MLARHVFGGSAVRLRVALGLSLALSACSLPLSVPEVWASPPLSVSSSSPSPSGTSAPIDMSDSSGDVRENSPGLPSSPTSSDPDAYALPIMADALPYVEAALVALALISLATMAGAIAVVARG